MSTQRATQILAFSSAFALLGFVLLMVALLTGFEEANTGLIVLASILIFAPPVAMLVHLSVTRELTTTEKRIWIHELASTRAGSAFATYFTVADRRAASRQLAREAVERRRDRR